MKYLFLAALVVQIWCVRLSLTQETPTQNKTRKFPLKKSLFSVIQFPNTACIGTGSRNGTCYTSSECATRRGVNSGSCANGYGVCCVITLACGRTSSENCTYLTLGATSNPGTACEYTICECNPNICRIRLDFNVFSINPPFVGTTVPVSANTPLQGGSVGDCVVDSFVVTSPNNHGSPVICGFNTGQHMYIDTSDKCSKALFSFGGAGFSRQYDIKVTQYSCGDERGGPPDCLQYFSANVGTVTSYNFQLTGSLVSSTTTHLSNQCYEICFRRNAGFCAICFQATILVGAGAPANQASFGLSSPVDTNVANALSLTDSNCISDYIVIPNGQSVNTIAVIGFTNGPARFCGRFLNVNSRSNANGTVCTGRKPFRIIFKTDADEVTYKNMPANLDETAGAPGGIIGFSLMYWQEPCTGAVAG